MYGGYPIGSDSQTGGARNVTGDNIRWAQGDQVGKDAFLKLLVAELKNQNPMDPMDNTQFVSQMAQFNTVEQMQNMARDSSFRYALGLTGRQVTARYPEGGAGETFTGTAVGVRTGDNGEPLLQLVDADGTLMEVSLDKVISVVDVGNRQLSDITQALNDLLTVQQMMLYQQSQAGAPVA